MTNTCWSISIWVCGWLVYTDLVCSNTLLYIYAYFFMYEMNTKCGLILNDPNYDLI